MAEQKYLEMYYLYLLPRTLLYIELQLPTSSCLHTTFVLKQWSESSPRTAQMYANSKMAIKKYEHEILSFLRVIILINKALKLANSSKKEV